MAIFTQATPKIEFLLTGIFFLEVALAFIWAPQHLPLGCPLGPMGVVATLLVCCLLLFPTIKVVKYVSGVSAAYVSRTLLAGDPLGKHRSRVKFEDQCWQGFIHTTMTALEVYTIFYDSGGEPWFRDYTSLWVPHPREQVHNKTSLHLLYAIQMGIWIVTAISHQFFEQRHKDYVLMYVHHLVTIALIGLSYTWGYVRMGACVLLLHDSSDIVIDLLKTTNYLKLEGLKYGFLVEICFVSNLFTWAYVRLYLYAYYVVWLAGWKGPRELFLSPVSPRVTWAKTITQGHAPGFKLANAGDGTFSVIPNILSVPTHEDIPGWWMFNGLMSSLVVMHLIWYLMFWRIFYRLLTKEKAHDAGREEYEGDSDDE